MELFKKQSDRAKNTLPQVMAARRAPSKLAGHEETEQDPRRQSPKRPASSESLGRRGSSVRAGVKASEEPVSRLIRR